MRLSDIKGEAALDVIADIIEPAAKIMADPNIADAFRKKESIAKISSCIIKNHKNEVIDILAALEREDRKIYLDKINLLTIPKKLMEMLGDPSILALFQSAATNEEENGSGSRSENAAEEI